MAPPKIYFRWQHLLAVVENFPGSISVPIKSFDCGVLNTTLLVTLLREFY